ncbi:hypothetical protein AgCh_013270 [Apium graveolens]
MDRLRRLGKPKSSAKNDQGDQHVRQEKSKLKLPSSSLVARLLRFDVLRCQNLIHRQRKSFAEGHASPVALQGDADLIGDESHKKRLTQQQHCKDIFEDKCSSSGSSKDSILGLLKKPNPLFFKHLQGEQDSSSSSLFTRHLPIPKQSNPENFEAKDPNLERNTFKKLNISSKKTTDDCILKQSLTLASTRDRPESSKVGGEEREGTDEGTASSIVILKPNYAMARVARNSSSSNDFSRVNSSGSRKTKGHTRDRAKDEDFVEAIDFDNGVEVSASQVREAKKKSKKVIEDLSGTTSSTKELEAKEAARRFQKEVQEVFSRMRTDFPAYVKEIPGTGGLYDFSKIDSASESEVLKMTSYDSTESFVSRQAKKRLLERWRRAQRNEHAREVGKGSTLGEMLCSSEDKVKNLDAAKCDSPSGISSADGWKDKYSKIKSRSLPLTGTGNENLYAECEYRTDDKLLMSKEAMCQSQSDRVHGDFTNEASSSKSSRSSKRESQSRHRRASSSNAYPDISENMLKQRDSSRGGRVHSSPKHLGSEAKSSKSSKEADASPIPVLEVPSREDAASGLECFKRVSADLQDLRKQLSVLSKESKKNFDLPMHIQTDFDCEEMSVAMDENDLVVSECWESFYIADVLIESGLHDMDTDIFMQNFKSPSLPLGPWVFHNLEKKYCDETSAPRHERMLLFDRIRSAVSEISQSYMNLFPWVKPMTTEFGKKCPKRKLRNEVHKFLALQDAKVIESMSETATEKVEDWGDLRNSVEMIGTKIERSLTNGLLKELVMELQLNE